MKIRYYPIMEVKLLHGYYSSKQGKAGFMAYPSSESKRLLANHNLTFRCSDTGFTLYGEVLPDTDPPKMVHSFGEEMPILSFWVEVKDRNLLAISDLPDFKPGKNCYYCNNLSDQRTLPVSESPLYLGDSRADKQLGAPVEIVSAKVYDYVFDSAIQQATLTIFDIFDKSVAVIPVDLPEASKEYRISLNPLLQLKPGRYVIRDNHGGEHDFYYAPGISRKSVFAVVEIYNTTRHLTSDGSEKVSAAYKYLSAANDITLIGPYVIELESLTTTWRYIVTKKYTNSTIELNELTILDPESEVVFIKTASANTVTFTADDTLAIRESGKRIELHRANTKLRELPVPTITTPLQQDQLITGFSSDFFVYV